MVEYDLLSGMRYANRILSFRDGRLVSDGKDFLTRLPFDILFSYTVFKPAAVPVDTFEYPLSFAARFNGRPVIVDMVDR
jgi:hypothetical protein